MNVTKYNFKKHLPFIIDCINESDYVAIDFEFTGIFTEDNLRNDPEDWMDVIYWK